MNVCNHGEHDETPCRHGMLLPKLIAICQVHNLGLHAAFFG
jgi:hypothetical protein